MAWMISASLSSATSTTTSSGFAARPGPMKSQPPAGIIAEVFDGHRVLDAVEHVGGIDAVTARRPVDDLR